MNPQEEVSRPVKQAWNWRIWAGFLVALAVIPSYFVFFAKYPTTRDVPWVSWLMFAISTWLLWTGIRRAFASSKVYRGRITGPILAVLSLGAAVFFGYATLYASRQLPAGGRAQSWGKSARVYACRYQRKYGGDVYVAFRADARNGGAKTTRVGFGLLPGILVTVLQLRVAGYSGALK